VCASSDVPAGVINIFSAARHVLLDLLARHLNVNAISAANLPREAGGILKMGIAENLKRVRIIERSMEEWLDSQHCESPWEIEPFVEMKTVWHPAAV
jgi:hypothetical protein